MIKKIVITVALIIVLLFGLCQNATRLIHSNAPHTLLRALNIDSGDLFCYVPIKHFLEDILDRFPLVNMVKINRARVEFFSHGTVTPGLVPDAIVHSWQRSVANGVAAESKSKNVPALSGEELAAIREKNGDLLMHSLPVIENLYEQIIHTSSMPMRQASSSIRSAIPILSAELEKLRFNREGYGRKKHAGPTP